jgi:cytochrome c2|tara:strand:- start:42 stop:542 length:501 start_codon:yes stop_codon:yes gene_type:complete
MKSTRLLGLIGLLIVGAIFVTACEAEGPEVVPTPIFEPTAAPSGGEPESTSVPAASDPASTAVPDEAPAALVGDSANGETLFGVNGCSGCHSTGANSIVGPGLSDVGATAATRVDGESADEYLTHAIVAPNDFLVDGYPGIMPLTFGDSLSKQEIADLVAYLVSLP